MRRLFTVLLVLLAVGVTAGEPDAAFLQPAVTENDIAFAACQIIVNGQAVEGDHRNGVLGALGLSSKGGGWSAGRGHGKEEADTYQFVLVFKKPLAIGSLLCPQGGTWRALKNDAPAADATKADLWEPVVFPPHQAGARLTAFRPDFQTRALLYEERRNHPPEVRGWRLYAARWHNIAPEALGNGEADYISYGDLHPPVSHTAAQFMRGGNSWQSHGPDNRNRIARAPISDIAPSWFVVSWEKPRSIAAVFLRDNFRDFKLLAYRGPEGVNPAVGTDEDWAPVPLPRSASREGRGDWLSFAPQTTRALKLHILKTEPSQYATLHSLLVATDLRDQPAPVPTATEEQPPLTISCMLPADGVVTMAIDDAQGRRVRNLLARANHKAGPLAVGWDLKDEDGKLVGPGTYRWKAITHPGLSLRYEMTPYPNIGDNAPENSPWLNGASGPGGWLADHTPPIAACPVGDRVFLSAPCAESGVALIECDLAGRKLWGHHNLAAWTGPSLLASDGRWLFCAAPGDTDRLWRFHLPDKKLDTFLDMPSSPTRRRGIKGMAAREGKLYLAVRGNTNWLSGAAVDEDVDIERCEPRYPPPPKSTDRDTQMLREDFLRLFRLTGTPPGFNGLHYLETAKDASPRQHIVLAFKRPVPVGSVVFPMPDDATLHVRLSVLKEKAPYPPQPNNEKDWTVFWTSPPPGPLPQGAGGRGWSVATAPENATTRALRISFDHGVDALDDLLNADDALTPDTAKKDKLALGDEKKAWRAQMEGMKLLRRRFANVPPAKVTVSSGQINKQGEWDAQREKPLTSADPAIYMMQWDAAQTIRGLALKEIDGKLTEIDAYIGPDGGAVDLRDDKQWKQVARYEQHLRDWYQGGQNYNHQARYVDGYVDFGQDVTTRAVRLRVVEQWTWREDDRAGCVGVRHDRGGQTLDPARCRIYGVAALKYLGGEAPLDPLLSERLEVYDAQDKKLLKEVPLEKAGDIAFNAAGELHAVSGAQVVKVDAESGKTTPVVSDLKTPRAIAFDKAGNLFVFDSAAERRTIRVYDKTGKFLREIGTPGGRIAGPWDPTRFCSHAGETVDLAIDDKDQIWVVEFEFAPKRISLWSTDGTFKKDFLGNTGYGGGGVLDPYDKKRLFYGPMEFELDWQTGKTRLKNMTWMGDSPAGEMPIKIKDRTYLVTRPTFGGNSVGVVYLYEKDRLRRVAALGIAGRFPPLRAADVVASLGRKPVGDFAFAWSDRNGDGKAQADEVTFLDDPGHVGMFDETLGVSAGTWRYEVKEFLPNGAPVYERRKLPGGRKGDYGLRLSNGSFFYLGGEGPDCVRGADGNLVWSYKSEGRGVHALYRAKPWHAGQVVAEFDVVGCATAHAGDLGEFLVTNGNSGIWHVWTADGLLAGQIFRDMRGPGAAPWSMREHERGLDLTGVTAGQEHFSGYFCRTMEDNRYYAVAGHNFTGVVEVVGIDQFKRLGGELRITPQEIAAAVDWARKAEQRKTYEAAKIIECGRAPENVKVDGDPKEWSTENARLADREVSLSLGYDDRNLYVCCQARRAGPLKNTGNDWRRLFKTGAAFDLQIGVDPSAPLTRTQAAPGDMRIVMTYLNGQATVVLYQPNCPGAKPEEAWETHTQVFRTAFDRVAKLDGVTMAMQVPRDGGEYCLEAAIPLAAIGLKIAPGTRLKMDWGILVSGPDGSEVLQRLYWSNNATAIVSDEAAEAMLNPGLWGFVRFSGMTGKPGTPQETRLDKVLRRDADIEGLKLEE
jgi:hypothetical protein